MNTKTIILGFALLFLLTACASNKNQNSNIEAEFSQEQLIQAKKTLLEGEKKSIQTEVLPQVITLGAKRWEYDTKEIRIKKDSDVTLRVDNTDTLHGIAIPDMQLVGDNEIKVDTSVAGEFEYRCAVYCGDGHEDMTGTIIIE